ncbi:hypothetical protein P8452_48539 [Trifolium repens]|nr:hypothetical protein P8452_48539 [Trifolium repens]
MKIKLELCILGVGFSYLIIILRSVFSSINAVIYNEDPNSLQVVVNSHSPRLARTDIQKVSVEEVQNVSLSDFRGKIERWIKTSNVAFKILFPTERRLCNPVFFGFSSAADILFTGVCRESTLQLLNFTDAIA